MNYVGQTLSVEIGINLNGKPKPNVRFYRAGRELREDSRITIVPTPSGGAILEIKKTRIQDEAKYSVSLDLNGAITDTATFSIFIKGEHSSLYRYLLF